MSFGARPIGLRSSVVLPPVLGFNDTGSMFLEYQGAPFAGSSVLFSANGPISYGPGTLGANAPTAWLLSGASPGVGSGYEIRFEISNVDVGPSQIVTVFGTDITFEPEPYDTGWVGLGVSRVVSIEPQGTATGATLDGIISIRNTTTLQTISRALHLFVFVPS